MIRMLSNFLIPLLISEGGKSLASLEAPLTARKEEEVISTPTMNLGGSAYKTCLKHQAGYTNKPGVWKPLSLGHLSLLQIFNSLPVLKTDELIAYPCCLANDGTALKPAIEFDERLKENVGLTRNLKIDFVKSNPQPTTAFLKDNLVTEAIVSSVTSLDNKCSLPCAIEYATKAGKTAESCKEMFEK